MYNKFWDVLGKVAIGLGLGFLVFMGITIAHASQMQSIVG